MRSASPNSEENTRKRLKKKNLVLPIKKKILNTRTYPVIKIKDLLLHLWRELKVLFFFLFQMQETKMESSSWCPSRQTFTWISTGRYLSRVPVRVHSCAVLSMSTTALWSTWRSSWCIPTPAASPATSSSGKWIFTSAFHRSKTEAASCIGISYWCWWEESWSVSGDLHPTATLSSNLKGWTCTIWRF